MSVLAAALRLDRLFVGYERGALGYLLVARRRSTVTPLEESSVHPGEG